jgi:hypothetical protein
MANKPEGDVTRKAVELATKKVAAATDKLKLILTTGPDQVIMSHKQIQDSVAQGNTGLVPYAVDSQGRDAAGTDNALLERMLANGQIRGRK